MAEATGLVTATPLPIPVRIARMAWRMRRLPLIPMFILAVVRSDRDLRSLDSAPQPRKRGYSGPKCTTCLGGGRHPGEINGGSRGNR